MQLQSVVLYHRDGSRMHKVSFDTGALNVVPGVSDTGKSALLEIVDYCLGSSKHRVSKEDELESIGWYGLMLSVNDDTVFVARERPAFAQNVSYRAMLRVGVTAPPAPHEIKQNTNVATVIRDLSGRIGIGDNDQPSTGTPDGTGLRATLRHATPYVFQPQELIADPRYLFAGQDEDKALHTRDTLPYFLGSVDEDAMQQRRQLRKAQQDLRSARTRLADLQSPSRELTTRTQQLVRDARAAGLMRSENETDDDRSLLVAASEFKPAPSRPSTESATASLSDLAGRRQILETQLREARISRRTLVQHRRLAHDYDTEVQEQRLRVSSLGLLGDEAADTHACPLCGSPDGETIATISDLRDELASASTRAEQSATAPPQLDSAIEDLDSRISSLRTELGDVESEISIALKRSRIPTEAREEREQRAFVLGRIASFLEEHPAPDEGEVADLQRKVDALEAQVDELETSLGSEATRNRTDVAVSYISDEMTRMARTLKLSYSGDGVRLDPFDLTVFGRDRRGPVRLDHRHIGSGKSWVGYHVVTLLAMHRFFIENDRPVPRMLLLDQPTQAFYPSEKQSQADRNLGDISDDDQEQVHRIFKLIRETASELDGALQVIILDHAEIPEPWFVEAVGGNNWRHGRALVPPDWF